MLDSRHHRWMLVAAVGSVLCLALFLECAELPLQGELAHQGWWYGGIALVLIVGVELLARGGRAQPVLWMTTLAVAVLAGLFLGSLRQHAGSWSGGSFVGLWLGVGGALLMLFAGLLAAHRGLLRQTQAPPPPSWRGVRALLMLASGVPLTLASWELLELPAWSLWLLAVGFLGLVLAGVASLALHWLSPWLLRLWPSRAWWLRGHVWLGLLSGVTLLCHSGFRWGGPLEQALWIAVLVTLASGVLGVALQWMLPRVLTVHVLAEVPYEHIPHVCRVLRQRADSLLEQICGAVTPQSGTARLDEEEQEHFRAFYDRQVRPFFLTRQRSGALADPLRAQVLFAQLADAPRMAALRTPLLELAELVTIRRQLVEQERLHHWLHGWLLVHVPAAVAVLVLGVLHAVTALYY